jgi:hypothetical protein
MAMSRLWIALIFIAWAPFVQANPVDKSDLNGDGIADDRDVEIFAGLYFEEPYETIDWCVFYESSMLNEKYFRRVVSDNIDSYKLLLDYIALRYACDVVNVSEDKSDLDEDGDVDLEDLKLFSTNYLEMGWQNVDWCVFHGSTLVGADYEGRSTKYYLKHFRSLLEFINEYFGCNTPEPPPDNFALENNPRFPTRIADATAINGKVYASDPRVGSVFVYNELMSATGELKGLNKPLGVALNAQGRIFVGNDGRDNIEVFDSTTGELVAVFGQGIVKMPTAITFDNTGNIYVVDSKLDRVHVFDLAYNLVRSIGRSGMGEGTLDFPMDAEIITTTAATEIYIADRGTSSVQVFDLEGNWSRSITFEGTDGEGCNWFTNVCAIPGVQGFTTLQALSKDSLGRLHVLDNFTASVVIFDLADDTYVGTYGTYGTEPGQLKVPMDVSVSATDMAIVTTGDGDRIEWGSLSQPDWPN